MQNNSTMKPGSHYIVWFIDLAYSTTYMNHTIAYWDGSRWLAKSQCPLQHEVMVVDGPVQEYAWPGIAGRSRRIPLEDYE